MAVRERFAAIRLGAALFGLSGLTSTIFFWQPWRSCEYEETAAGCAMLQHDAAILTAAIIVAVVGLTMIPFDYGRRRRSV